MGGGGSTVRKAYLKFSAVISVFKVCDLLTMKI